MKKFRFRLQALLKQREQIEKDCQRELAEAMRRAGRQKDVLTEIGEQTRETLARKREKQAGALSVGDLQIYSRYQYRLKREALGAEELLRALRKTEGQKREALLTAAKNRKVYDTLKERQRERFFREAAALERKEADEIGLNAYRLGRSRAERDE